MTYKCTLVHVEFKLKWPYLVSAKNSVIVTSNHCFKSDKKKLSTLQDIKGQ